MNDEEYMRRALLLADRALGNTSPNPLVGAVLVADGEIVGEGWHIAPGEAHAEVAAIDAAGDRARGATLYVTLEPCTVHGRTPPCVDAVVEAGVARVVVAQTDPDPRVRGAGLATLRAAGVEVSEAVLGSEAARQIRAYRHQRRTGRPLVVLKIAETIDGAGAAPDGSSQWITSERSRSDAHELRRASDAVVVGSGTVLSDDPRLTVRTEPAPRSQPLRVVVDRRHRVPRDAAVFGNDAESLRWDGDIGALVDELAAREMLQVLVEGGPIIAGAFLRADLVDRLVVYVGSMVAGGDDARAAFAGPAFPTVDRFRRFGLETALRLGDDLRLDYVPVPGARRGGPAKS